MNVLRDRMLEIARCLSQTLSERVEAQLIYCDGEGNLHARPWRGARSAQLEPGAFACGVYERDVSVSMLADHLVFLRSSVQAVRRNDAIPERCSR